MNLNDELVEHIVATVLQELADADDSCSAGESIPLKKVALSEKVITADVIKSRINGAKSIHVSTSAIVTPSARDFLRAHDIECHTQTQTSNSETKQQSNRRTRWKLVISHTSDTVEGVIEDAIRREDTDWSKELASDCREAAELGVSLICRSDADSVVVLARAATGVACLANRNKKVRAAAVKNADDVAAAKAEIGANLIAVNPDGNSFFELRNILKTFASGGPSKPPAVWD